MKQKRYTKNLHTHTFRCKHAVGDIDDYVRAAVKAGGTVLGFSDHTPLPDGRWPDVRMTMDQLPEYIGLIQKAREQYPKIKIIGGLECEYTKEYCSFYQDKLLADPTIEYLIAGIHYYKKDSTWHSAYGGIKSAADLTAYADCIIAAIECGLFTFIAHPDLFANCYRKWDNQAIACSRAILEAAADRGVPLEINGYGMRKPKIDTYDGKRSMYPLNKFWELAAGYDIRVVASSDAHRPQDVYASLDACHSLIEKLGLRLAKLELLQYDKL